MFWVSLAVGVFVGSIVTILALALCSATEGDDED